MRGSSLRALLIVFALVVQTIASAAGCAIPASSSAQASIEHCPNHSGPAAPGDSSAPNKAVCQHCLACLGGVAVAPETGAVGVVRLATPIEPSTLRESLARAAAVNIDRARGPPSPNA